MVLVLLFCSCVLISYVLLSFKPLLQTTFPLGQKLNYMLIRTALSYVVTGYQDTIVDVDFAFPKHNLHFSCKN